MQRSYGLAVHGDRTAVAAQIDTARIVTHTSAGTRIGHTDQDAEQSGCRDRIGYRRRGELSADAETSEDADAGMVLFR